MAFSFPGPSPMWNAFEAFEVGFPHPPSRVAKEAFPRNEGSLKKKISNDDLWGHVEPTNT